MALFDEPSSVSAAPTRRRRRAPRSRAAVIGTWGIAVALVALLVLTVLPTSFVIQQPGPVFNTLGVTEDADGEALPLIQVEGAPSYETAGELDLTTVQVVGNRQRTPSWLELALAWFDASRAVVPIEQVFPDGVSSEQRQEESAAMMVDSQKEATAAALTELGYDVQPMVRVHALTDDSAAQGLLQPDDVIVAADGTPVSDTAELREVIAAGEGAPVSLDVLRDGESLQVEVTPTATDVDGETVWLIGVTTLHDYEFPFDVTIQLDDVGGPSAGMMFALGIIDTLTPDELTGGESIAGTGTIDAAGTVGPIGGIRQKLYGAQRDGATSFLAPQSNCDEVVGHIPDGLEVYAVETLDDSLAALDAIASGDGLDELATCAG